MDRDRTAAEPEGEEAERSRSGRGGTETRIGAIARTLPGGLRLWCSLLGIGLVIALVNVFVAEPFTVPSASMENTLRPGDRLVVDKLAYLSHGPRRGDVVVFDGDGAFGGGGDYVKRVIGVGGDHVRCCDARHRITVNGRALDERAYLAPGDRPSQVPFDIRVPRGRVWVLGDHRSRSSDSRDHLGDPGGGMVPDGEIVGRVRWVVWPVSHWRTLDRPGALAARNFRPNRPDPRPSGTLTR